jgi:hypothetical protein
MKLPGAMNVCATPVKGTPETRWRSQTAPDRVTPQGSTPRDATAQGNFLIVLQSQRKLSQEKNPLKSFVLAVADPSSTILNFMVHPFRGSVPRLRRVHADDPGSGFRSQAE